MILKALYDYYHRCGDLAPQGWEYKEISFIIVLDTDGNLIDVEDARSEDNKHGTPYLVVKGVRSGTAPKPYLFWDNVEYTCNYVAPNPKNSPERQAELLRKAALKHNALVDKFKAVSSKHPENPALKAVCLFYENGGLENLYAHHMWQEIIKKPTVNISYRLDENLEIVAEESCLANEIADSSCYEDSGKLSNCLISGKPCEPVESTSPTPIPGSQATARLVSFQVNSGYDSYGKQKGLNAPISKEAEASYTTALNRLLGKGSQNKYIIGNRTLVFWGSSNSEATVLLENALAKELNGFGDEIEETEENDPNVRVEAVKKTFESIYSGNVPGALTDRFYILGLAPNSARIAVTHWSDTSLRDFASNMLKHHEDMEIADRRTDKKPYTGLYNILRAIAVNGKVSDIKSNLPEAIVKSIVEGRPYPYSLMQQVILRIHADHKVDIVRAAIIKAYLNRIDRNKQKQLTVMLSKEEKNIGYLCGRLFAVLEYTQRKALGTSTIAERYYGAAMSTPAIVFPTLSKLTRHHLNKISNPGFNIYIEKIKLEITDKMPSTGFPARLNIYDQGRFAVGYDHQKSDLYTHKEEENNNDNNN
ncbi:MAG: type I-C CRISPR-associated protein Cas8c/Csd1 [Muribaculaceae bacterium]|nr:type I-C CRISPR-associated protein Cas8c/Csd1 [Muribaculaceae bacterium]